MTKYLGFDIGTKTIGFATSDALNMIATPLHTLKRVKFTQDIALIKQIIDEHHVTDCVLGLPLNMDGTEGARCQATRAFARNLAQHVACPIHFWDERMSSMAVERTMLAADLSRAKRAQHVDKLAASYILQGFLDSKRMTL
jgi:putative holliday junction resolvase